jgi:rare lipoprotein A
LKSALKTAALLALAAAAFCALARTHAHAETCQASWYGAESGRVTASGERFRPDGFTAAHRSIAFGTMIGVHLGSRKIMLRANDRGPAAWAGRCLDLSRGRPRARGAKSRVARSHAAATHVPTFKLTRPEIFDQIVKPLETKLLKGKSLEETVNGRCRET